MKKIKCLKCILIPCLSIIASTLIIIPIAITAKKPRLILDRDAYLGHFSPSQWLEGVTDFNLDQIYLTKPLEENFKIYVDMNVIYMEKEFSNFSYDEGQPCTIFDNQLTTPLLHVTSYQSKEHKIRDAIFTLSLNFRCVDEDDNIIWTEYISKVFIGRHYD